jgi:acetyl-CoA carboxylase biotin carboxyl carrier protein
MDIKDLKTLIKMVTETDITELELTRGDESVKLKRGTCQQPVIMAAPAPAMMAAAPVAPVAATASVAAPAAVSAPQEEVSGQPITSPIVGTFYRAPSPDSPPYVEVGQVVEKGQVFCIVEAMKLMNEIEAEYRCRIVKICKENAQPVEFGDALFIVEPA